MEGIGRRIDSRGWGIGFRWKTSFSALEIARNRYENGAKSSVSHLLRDFRVATARLSGSRSAATGRKFKPFQGLRYGQDQGSLRGGGHK